MISSFRGLPRPAGPESASHLLSCVSIGCRPVDVLDSFHAIPVLALSAGEVSGAAGLSSGRGSPGQDQNQTNRDECAKREHDLVSFV